MKASDFKQLIKEAVREAVREELQALKQPQENIVVKATTSTTKPATPTPLMEMINQTRSSMTSDDFRNIAQFTTENVGGGAMPMTMNGAGLDIRNLDFVKNASAVLKASEQKDKAKYGL